MHEIRAKVPPEYAAETARLAHDAGIERVSIANVYFHGPELRRQIVSVETSTPKAGSFPGLGSIRLVPDLARVRAIIDGTDVAALTRPMSELSRT